MVSEFKPSIILVRTQLPENIGAAARAMSNFGLADLRLVAPRDGWPQKRAFEMASGGQSILESATVHDTLAEAMHGITHAYACTARPRDMEKRVITPEDCMQEIFALCHPERSKGSLQCEDSSALPQDDNIKAAILFGPERTGLENSEIVACDAIVTIPTATENPSLNIAQAVVVMAYSWMNVTSPSPPQGGRNTELATKKELIDLLEHIEGVLDLAEHFPTEAQKPVMWQNLQNTFSRMQLSGQEVRTFRGVLRSLARKMSGPHE